MARRRSNDGRRKNRRGSSHAELPAATPKTPFSQKACLGAVAALLVARVFVPEDPGGEQGHGAAFTMLWLVLGCSVAFLRSKWNGATFRWGWPEVALGVLIGWHTLSALVAASQGAPRQALNLMWDWIAMGAAYLMVRQLIRTPQLVTALLAAMIALAAALSMVGIRQYFVTLHADQAAYEAARGDLQALYQLTGEWLPPDSTRRIQFENRLGTNQPTATFGLTNSLAAFLLPWLILLSGALLHRLNGWRLASDSPQSGRFSMVVAIIAILLMFVCLALTQSRSAILTAALALVVVAVLELDWLRSRRQLTWLAVGAAAFLSTGAALLATTSAGRAIWSAAWKSVSFRLDYWQATIRMIFDYPILGVGPGQFQDYYVSYKLPTAPEEIQDPHNWLFEIWATAGTIAVAAFIAFLVIVVQRTIRAWRSGSLSADMPGQNSQNQSESLQWIFAGGVGGVLLGVILAWLSGYPVDGTEVVLFVIGLAIAPVLWRFLQGIQNRWVPLCLMAAGTMLFNLLAAGGIGYPSVAESFWLLVAVSLNGTEFGKSNPQPAATMQAGGRRWLPIAAWLALMLAALWTEYLPVTGTRLQLDIADRALMMGNGAELRAALEGAVRADPWSVTAALRLASQRFDDYEQQPTSSVRELFEKANERVLQLAPRRSSAWRQSAEFFERIYNRTRQSADLEVAIERAKQAAAYYSASAEIQALLAKLYGKTGDTPRSQAAAAEAIRLDDLMRAGGHKDRQLPEELRKELMQIAAMREE